MELTSERGPPRSPSGAHLRQGLAVCPSLPRRQPCLLGVRRSFSDGDARSNNCLLWRVPDDSAVLASNGYCFGFPDDATGWPRPMVDLQLLRNTSVGAARGRPCFQVPRQSCCRPLLPARSLGTLIATALPCALTSFLATACTSQVFPAAGTRPPLWDFRTYKDALSWQCGMTPDGVLTMDVAHAPIPGVTPGMAVW